MARHAVTGVGFVVGDPQSGCGMPAGTSRYRLESGTYRGAGTSSKPDSEYPILEFLLHLSSNLIGDLDLSRAPSNSSVTFAGDCRVYTSSTVASVDNREMP